jgi:hypothetical protein
VNIKAFRRGLLHGVKSFRPTIRWTSSLNTAISTVHPYNLPLQPFHQVEDHSSDISEKSEAKPSLLYFRETHKFAQTGGETLTTTQIVGVNYFHITIHNGPTNELVCIKTLIKMSHTKTFKITPTCFDHQMIIIRELSDPG